MLTMGRAGTSHSAEAQPHDRPAVRDFYEQASEVPRMKSPASGHTARQRQSWLQLSVTQLKAPGLLNSSMRVLECAGLVPVVALPYLCCMTLNKLLNLSGSLGGGGGRGNDSTSFREL